MFKSISLIVLFVVSGVLVCFAKSETPVLVLANQADFGLYTGEILKTEGFNEYRIDSLSDQNVSLQFLKRFDVVILAQNSISQKQKEMLATFVKDGGNLIAFRPDKKLSDVFGIKDAGGTVSEGYIAVDNKTGEARKITSETMQFHGTADKYTLNKGRMVAALYSDAQFNTGCPAIVSNQYGNGHAMAFLYNLPQSVVYTRQGNPQFAGLEEDGIVGLRGMDLFAKGWLNNSKNTLNQADEQNEDTFPWHRNDDAQTIATDVVFP